ncbi:hypothetical protein V1478_012863 [Vespula squamosa]|uniref:Uncharacterized protein n=1 Tax=Vespula squamosa TaxID=30214 RepID=A0ABD2A963_VESSQ
MGTPCVESSVEEIRTSYNIQRNNQNLRRQILKIYIRQLTHIDTKLGTEQSEVIDNRTSLVSARFLAKFGSPPINYSTKDCFPFPVVYDPVESSRE